MSDAVALEVGTIGENMRLRRAIFLPKLEGLFLNSYVHNSGENKSCTNFLLCKYIIFIFIIYYLYYFYRKSHKMYQNMTYITQVVI